MSFADFPTEMPMEVHKMPNDDEIINDWRRHDAFRFRSVLFPILLMLLATAGQWTSSPWTKQMTQQSSFFEHWGSITLLTQDVWLTRMIFFGMAPLLTVLCCQPLSARFKMRVVIGLALFSFLIQSLALLNTSRGMFIFTVATSSFSFGLSFHTVVMVLLNWFPDFSVFAFAAVALVTVLSHWFTLSMGESVADKFALPVLPIFQALVFMFTTIPLHFFIQAPPIYIPLFIRSMLQAASLPQSKTLPLPTTLGIAARIPRALGKLQQWKKKLKSRGSRRRGYGELVNDLDIDEFEEVEMQVSQGYDDDLGDLYARTDPPPNTPQTKVSQQAKLKKMKQQQLECDLTQIAIDMSANNAQTSQNNGGRSGNNSTTITPSEDPLMMAAMGITSQKPTQTPQVQNTPKSGLYRPSDDEDNGDPAFAFEDDTDIPKITYTTQDKYMDTVTQQDHPIHSNNTSFSVGNRAVSENAANKAPKEDYNNTVGLALSAVVSQLDHYNPLPIPLLLNSRPFQLYIASTVLPLLFPFLLLHLTPEIYVHLQNRTLVDAQNLFTSHITWVVMIAVAMLILAQFFGNKGLLTFSSLLMLFGSFFWATCVVIGNQHNTSLDPAITRSYSPIHLLIALIYVGTTIYTFLTFTTIQKYFHDENVRITSALTLFMLSAVYVLSSAVLLPLRNPLVENNFTPPTRIAINAQAYDWISRAAVLATFISIVCLYKLRPLVSTERFINTAHHTNNLENDLESSPYHENSTIIEAVSHNNDARGPATGQYD